LRILCTGDLHLGSSRRRIDPDMVVEGDKKILDAIVNVATEECVDYVFILGDLFDSNEFSSTILASYLDKLSKIKKSEIYIFPGNHDYKINFNFNNITVFRGWMQKDICEGITLFGYGYQKDNKDFNKRKFDKKGQMNIICGHFSVSELQRKGKQNNSEICLNTHDIVSWEADIVLLGHDHNSRCLKHEDKLIAAYVGAPYNIYENEWVTRGVLICDIIKDEISLKIRKLDCPEEFKIKAKNEHTSSEIKTRYRTIPVGEYTWELISPININGKG